MVSKNRKDRKGNGAGKTYRETLFLNHHNPVKCPGWLSQDQVFRVQVKPICCFLETSNIRNYGIGKKGIIEGLPIYQTASHHLSYSHHHCPIKHRQPDLHFTDEKVEAQRVHIICQFLSHRLCYPLVHSMWFPRP